MQFKIPQNVQIEDKIVGPLTFKQLITLGIGGGMTYFVYVSLAGQYFAEIWLPPVLILALFTLAFTFVRPLGVSFSHYTLLLIEFWGKPRKRIWIKGAADIRPSVFTNVSAKKTKIQKKAEKKHTNDRSKLKDLDKLTSILDTHSRVIEGNSSFTSSK
ncbi:PrgI family protein [Candidatus Peregrinibacteria bacterium]|nr:PrgI family protein [Candidatus Peregrinibacteria bacterium]